MYISFNQLTYYLHTTIPCCIFEICFFSEVVIRFWLEPPFYSVAIFYSETNIGYQMISMKQEQFHSEIFRRYRRRFLLRFERPSSFCCKIIKIYINVARAKLGRQIKIWIFGQILAFLRIKVKRMLSAVSDLQFDSGQQSYI